MSGRASFHVESALDGRVYSINVLQSQLETMTVADIKDAVEKQSGIAAADFILDVGGATLDDDWVGDDFGLQDRTKLGLKLVPGVPLTKYSGRVSPVLCELNV